VLAQRPGGPAGPTETLFDMSALGLPNWIEGITFSQVRMDPGTSFRRLQVTIWDNDPDEMPGTGARDIYEIDLSPAGGGLFTPTGATRFVTLPVGTEAEPIGSATGIHYVPAGPFEGSLMYASWDVGVVRYIAIDPANGLPIPAGMTTGVLGTSNPIDTLFASDLGIGPLAVEFDPITNDLFLSTSQGDPLNTIFQIGGFVGGPVTTTTVTSTTQPNASTTSTTSITTTTLPSMCSAEASFGSILCRLGELGASVAALGSVAPAVPRLQGKVQKATTLTMASEQALAGARRRPAKASLAKAARQMNGFRKVLRTRKARDIPSDVRTALGQRALELRDAIKALRATI
jgi:hypothetical protein